MRRRIAGLLIVAASASGAIGAAAVAEQDSRTEPIKAHECVQLDCTAPRPLR